MTDHDEKARSAGRDVSAHGPEPGEKKQARLGGKNAGLGRADGAIFADRRADNFKHIPYPSTVKPSRLERRVKRAWNRGRRR